MTARPFLIFLMAVILTAFFVPPVSSNEYNCLGAEQAKVFEPIAHVKGVGIREGGLVKLSVSSEGYWMLTLSPPELNGALCIIMMGESWTFVDLNPAGEKVRYGRSD
mgnify:CR=1 FL=1